MTCSVTLVAFDKPKALVVPLAAVFPDADGKESVYVTAGEGKHEKRSVSLGKRIGDKAEVLAGLKAGEEILLKKPAEEKP